MQGLHLKKKTIHEGEEVWMMSKKTKNTCVYMYDIYIYICIIIYSYMNILRLGTLTHNTQKAGCMLEFVHSSFCCFHFLVDKSFEHSFLLLSGFVVGSLKQKNSNKKMNSLTGLNQIRGHGF